MDWKHNKNLVPIARTLRKNMTKEERRLWYEFLREYELRFQRQKIIGHYVVDFYCASAKLVVELDGSQHFEPEEMERDAQRTVFLEQYGITVVRIPNNEVSRNFAGVCEYIDDAVKRCAPPWLPCAKGAVSEAD